MKTIGIDARFYGVAGPGRYVKNIIRQLEQSNNNHKYVVFLRKEGFDTYNPQNPNFTKVLADYKWYSFEEQFLFLAKLLQHKLDLLYVPHFNIPVLYPKKLVTAIPDIIMHKFSTERGTTLPKPYFMFKKFVYYWVVLLAVLKSSRVIVPSNDVKNDFLDTYKYVPKSKFVIAYEGIDPDLLTTPEDTKTLANFHIIKPFILYISSMYEHKNVKRLVQAFKILIEKYGFTGQLVLVGKKDKFSAKIVTLVHSLNLSDRVRLPGEQSFVTDAQTVSLRKNAELYVFPSLKEGFSLTPLEAMALNLPTVISDIPCHKEIYGDSTYYFDPTNSEDIASKLNDVLSNPQLKHDLVNRGLEQVKKYSWSKTAQITLEAFNAALE